MAACSSLLADNRRPAVVEKLHREFADDLAVVASAAVVPVGVKRPITVASTPSDVAQLEQLFPRRFRHGNDHPLLRLGDPDLGVRETLVLQRRLLEPDLRADLSPISPTALENPPAPQSVTAW